MNGEVSNYKEFRKTDVDYILIKIDDTHIDKIPESIEIITDYLLKQNNILIPSYFCSIIQIIVVNELLTDNTPLTDRRIEIVSNLIYLFGNTVSIIHGRRNCIIGNLGSKSFMQYSYVLSNIIDLLKHFSTLKNSDIIEL
jgi:hypothetical protein